MTRYDHLIKLLALIGCVLFGFFITIVLTGVLLVSFGIPFGELAVLSEKGIEAFPAGLIRSMLAVQHIGIFIIPGLLFGYITYRSKIFDGLDLSVNPSTLKTLMGILFLLVAYPLVNLSFLLNESIPLPSWAHDFESQAEETLRAILEMDSMWIFILNLLLIAVLPGIGEELLFRGIVQKHLGGLLKSPVAAIWISALIFSVIHMQFEGLLPRMVLGTILGYLYYWTGNLWVPIITHAFNNGLQIILIYTMGMELDAFEQEGSDQLEWWMLVLSIGAMYAIYRIITKNKNSIGEERILHS